MQIIEYALIHNESYNITTSCHIHYLHIRLSEPEQALQEFLDFIAETSWINQLDCFTSAAYQVRVNKTVKLIIEKLKNEVMDGITEQSGEYLVSYAASSGLAMQCNHTKIPLAELWKEKVLGNPGFDFHTETPSKIIIFGESKYSSISTPHMDAVNQIMHFIQEEKDVAELSDLINFIQQESAHNAKSGKKGFAAAFSVNAQDVKRAIVYPLKDTTRLATLLNQDEIYLIGVEI